MIKLNHKYTIEFVRLQNPSHVKALLKLDGIYDYFKDDGGIEFENFIPNIENDHWYAGMQDDQIVGVFLLRQLNPILAEAHFALTERFRGRGNGFKYIEQFFRYASKKTNFKTVIGFVPEHRKAMIDVCNRITTNVGFIPNFQVWNKPYIRCYSVTNIYHC